MAIGVEDLLLLIEDELRRVSDPDRRRRLQSLLSAPTPRSVAWNYGSEGERHNVWIVGRSPDGDVLLAYSDVGFGPAFPWGGIIEVEDSAGMDSQWHSGLEDAAVCFGLLGAPPGYEVPGPR
jgi:hypothetical protein